MNFSRSILLAGLILAILSGGVAQAGKPLSLSDMATLQAAMQQHINRSLVDGTYLQIERKSGEVRTLHPSKSHPMILRMGSNFVMCAEFRDNSGTAVNVDFYLAPRGKSYLVFHTAIDDRALLEELMAKGKVETID